MKVYNQHIKKLNQNIDKNIESEKKLQQLGCANPLKASVALIKMVHTF